MLLSFSFAIITCVSLKSAAPVVALQTLHCSVMRRKRLCFRSSYCRLQMGLYDSPLPPPPPDDFAEKYKKSKQSKKKQFWISKDDEDGEDEDSPPATILFYFDDSGQELSCILPPLGRNPFLVSSFYEPTDNLVRSVVRMTQCHPQDACWALEAFKGNVMDASVAIALAQRKTLNKRAALPSEENKIDLDDELKNLTNRASANDKQNPETRTPEEWRVFEQEGYSLGNDGGLQERKKSLSNRERSNEIKRLLEPGKPNEDWLPGKPSPKPLDDEPWFTG